MNNNGSGLSIADLFELSASSADNFCIVSGWHQGKTSDTNRMAHEQLKNNVRNLDSGFIELRCSFVFTKSGKEQASEEKALLVTSPNLHDLLLLGCKYAQLSILYRFKDRFELLDTAVGKVLASFTLSEKSHLKDFSMAYTTFILSRNNDMEELKSLSIEKRKIPTRLDSLISLKNKEGLAEAKWVILF